MNSSRQPGFVCRWEPAELACTILSAPSREVVSYWISALTFLDENQHPVVLATSSHGDLNFNQLVREVNPGYAAPVILNELLRKGVVEQSGSDQVLLRRSTYVHDVPGFDVSPGQRRKNYSPDRSAGRRYSDEF